MATVSGPQQTGPLLAALQTLYSNSSRAEKESANSYLETFQKSVSLSLFCSENGLMRKSQSDSWEIVLGILQPGSTVGPEVKIFAAQTLRSKVRVSYKISNFVDQIRLSPAF
jgi:transportin-3